MAGAAAVAFPVLSTFAVELWTAIAFAIAGVAQTIHAFAARSWGGLFWGLQVGLLYLAAGVVLWLNPVAGVVTLTVLGRGKAEFDRLWKYDRRMLHTRLTPSIPTEVCALQTVFVWPSSTATVAFAIQMLDVKLLRNKASTAVFSAVEALC